MSDCVFVENGTADDGRFAYVCPSCGKPFRHRRKVDPSEITRACTGPDRNTIPCIHKGPELRQQKCSTCSGNVRLKVFACALLKECTVEHLLPGIQGCLKCQSYKPSEAEQVCRIPRSSDPSGGSPQK